MKRVLFIIFLLSVMKISSETSANAQDLEVIKNSEFSHFNNEKISILLINTDNNKDTFEKIKIKYSPKPVKFKGKLPNKTIGWILKENKFFYDIDTLLIKNTTYIDLDGSLDYHTSYWILGEETCVTKRYDENNNIIKNNKSVLKNNKLEVLKDVFDNLKDYNIFPVYETRDTVNITRDDVLDLMFDSFQY